MYQPSTITSVSAQHPHLGVEELISPQPLHEFGYFNLEFVSVDLGKLFERESPTMKP